MDLSREVIYQNVCAYELWNQTEVEYLKQFLNFYFKFFRWIIDVWLLFLLFNLKNIIDFFMFKEPKAIKNYILIFTL